MAQSKKPVVLVTGASAGIGYATCRRFAEGGYNIVAVARRKDRLEGLAKELSGKAEVAISAVDVTTPDAAKKSVAVAMEAFGRLDALVNNAGSFTFGQVDSTEDDALDAAIEINLKAPFRFSRESLKVMGQGASVVTIGSVWGILGGMSGSTYCTLKHGLVGLTQSIAIDYGPKGIRANFVAPSVVRTDMTDSFWDTDYFQRSNQELTPLNRDGTVDDIANAVYFLASDQGSFINGQTLAVDGGWSTTKFISAGALTATRVASS